VELQLININNRATPVKKWNFVIFCGISRENVMPVKKAKHDEAALPWIFFIQVEEYLKNILYFFIAVCMRHIPIVTFTISIGYH
jgi:hypothetical protein